MGSPLFQEEKGKVEWLISMKELKIEEEVRAEVKPTEQKMNLFKQRMERITDRGR